MRRLRVSLPLAGLLLAGPGAACQPALGGEGVHRTEGKEFVVAWRPVPAPLRVSEFFAVELATCSRTRGGPPTTLRVDAVMPEHRHGMNYRPTVAATGEGRFRAEGLLLHMPGLWEFRFDVRAGPVAEVLRERVTLR
jgi:hypothetical protein